MGLIIFGLIFVVIAIIARLTTLWEISKNSQCIEKDKRNIKANHINFYITLISGIIFIIGGIIYLIYTI